MPLDAWTEALVARRNFLCKHVPKCECGEVRQIQLLTHGSPAKWRCRTCGRRWIYEPPKETA